MRYNPFNPQMPARPQFFVGREPEIAEFEKYLSQTMQDSPMNMSINGNRGMGKTSLLGKFEESGKNGGCLVLRISNYEGNVSNIIDLADYISVNVKRELLLTKPFGPEYEKLKQYAASIKPTIGFRDVTLTIEHDKIVQDMLRVRLLKLWSEMKNDFKACVLLIDEAESLEVIPGAFIFLREVFQRTAIDANYMVVLAGKLNFPDRMSESFSPLNRFFPCSSLSPFDDNEVKRFVKEQLARVEVSIDDDALGYVIEKCEGHPYVLVKMCYMLFDAIGNSNRITLESTKKAEETVYVRLAQDFFTPMYHPLSPGGKRLIKQVSSRAGYEPFVFSDVVKWMNSSSNRISPYILELMRKGIIYKLERGKYQIFHGLFADYINSLTESG